MSINNQRISTVSQGLYIQKSEKYVADRKKYHRYNRMFFLSVFCFYLILFISPSHATQWEAI